MTIAASAQGFLPEDKGHRVAWYEFGNPDGTPVLFLHGGPGSGFNRDYLDLFPLDKIRFITFDQRGSGASQPPVLLQDNTTAHLLHDIERLRQVLKVESWVVCGHSWGATLAIMYAKAYPKVCRKILLASYFGALPEDQSWTFKGAGLFFPEEVGFVHELHTDKSVPFCQWVVDALQGSQRYEVAYRLSCLIASMCRMKPQQVKREDITDEAVGRWLILMHYAKHDFFLAEIGAFNNMHAITMPIMAIHGRYDMDCPPAQLWRLKALLPQVDIIVGAGSHSIFEEPMKSLFTQSAAMYLRE